MTSGAGLRRDRGHGTRSACGRVGVALLGLLLLTGCASSTGKDGKGAGKAEEGFSFSDLMKTDINIVVETNQKEVLAHLRLLMEKLYRRNPKELHKNAPDRTIEEQLARIFDLPPADQPHHEWKFAELQEKRGTECIQLAFDESFQGDRVQAYVVGLASMILSSYEYKTEFFILDDLDAQKLYNSARNIEVAVWKLSNDKDSAGELFIISNETEGPVRNLSYERLFGKLIALQDVMSRNVAQKTKRVIKHTLQLVASAVFLPI